MKSSAKSFRSSKTIIIALVFLMTAAAAVIIPALINTSASPGAPAPMAPSLSATKTDAIFTDVDGDGKADPGDTLEYTVTITNGGPDPATNVQFTDMVDANTTFVPGSVTTTPVALNDTYAITGNVQRTIAAPGVLANDQDPDGDTLTASGPTTSTNGGNVTVNADGSFTYNPPPGFTGTDTFTYTVTDPGGLTDTATVTLNVADMFWFIDDSAPAGGDGRLSSPFNSIAAFNSTAADDPGDFIFLYSGNYTGSLTLLNMQKLIGQGVDLTTESGVTPPPGSLPFPGVATNPVITNTGNVVTLAMDNHVKGLTIGDSSATGTDITGLNFGTLTVKTVTLNGGGRALSLTTGTVAGTGFTSLESTSGTNGILLTTVGGTVTSGSTNIQNSGGAGITISTSGATMSFGNTVVNSSAGTGVFLGGNTGPITFGDLDITPDSGQRGLQASANTGLLTVATGSTVTTTNNTPVEVIGIDNANRTPINMVFSTVSSSNSPNGIRLEHVSGTGFTSNGGTINGTTGGDGTTGGTGIRLVNANAITIANMNISGTHQNFGIRGDNVNGFTMSNTNVNGTMGTNDAFDEAPVSFTQLLGSASITGGTIGGSVEDIFRLVNTSGTLNRITISGVTFGTNSTTTGADALFIQSGGTATLNATVQNSTFTNARGELVQTDVIGTGVLDLIFTGNTLTNNNTAIVSGGGGTTFSIAGSTGATFTYNIANNSFRDADGAALAVSGGNNGVVSSGKIDNNDIGVAATANSGSKSGSGIAFVISAGGTHSINIKNNDVRQYNNHGILLQVGDSMGAATNINAVVTGNSVNTPGTINTDFNAIHLNHGTVIADNFTSCFDIGGAGALANNVAGGGKGTVSPNNADIRLRQRQATTVRLPGYGGANNNDAAVVAYLSARNTLTTAAASNTVPTGGGFIGGAACTLPANAQLVFDAAQASSLKKDFDKAGPQERVYRDILFAPENVSNARGASAIQLGYITPVVQAAIERWRAMGVSAEDMARLQAVQFEVADLPDDQLVVTTPDRVIIDESAADFGWFIDSTPDEDSEFEVGSGNWIRAKQTSQALTQIDLFTAVSRALNYVIEHDWTKRSINRYSLDQRVLEPGTRRTPIGPVVRPTPLPEPVEEILKTGQAPASTLLPTGQSIISTTPASENAGSGSQNSFVNAAYYGLSHGFIKAGFGSGTVQPTHAMLSMPRGKAFAPMMATDVSRTINTLPAAKSVVIKFRVTINNPVPQNVVQVCNQGNITADGGISLVTNDPDTGAPNDPTCTPLDVADVAVTKTDTPDPVAAGNNITYTVNFVNNGPSAAQNVTVTDAVPANTTFVSAVVTTGTGWSTSAPAVGGTGNIVFSKTPVPSGETAVFTIVVKVNASTANGTTITNTATAATTSPNPTANDASTITTTVATQADLAVTKTDTPDPVIASQNLTYTINFVNNGPSDAQNVTVTDAVPANTTFVSAVVTTGTGWSTAAPAVGGTGNVVFSKATVPVGETAVFTIVVNVNGNAVHNSTITNNAVAASTTTDPTPGNNTGTATTTVIAQADLAVTKSDSPDPVNAGQNITYTVNFVNNGPATAQMVTVTDAIPANTTFVSAVVTTGTGWSTAAPAVGATGNVVFSKAMVPSGETAVFTIVVKVNASTAAGTVITNSATAATTNPDPDNTNDTGTATTTVQTRADLAVTKSDSPDPVTAGNNITYTVNFVNNGPSDAQMVTVTDAVPANTTFVSAVVTTGTGWSTAAPAVGGTGNIVFSKTPVAAGETATFTIVVNVNANTANGATITNTATAATTTTDPDSSNDSGTATTTVATQADLMVTKVDTPDPVSAGNNITYTVNFVNNGPSDAQMVTVTDAVPANTTFVSAVVTTGMGWSTAAPAVGGTGNIVFSKTPVAAGETATFTIVVKVNSNTADGATITNNAVAASATTDPTPGNNTGTATTTVNMQADLAITKTDSPDPAFAGTNITYTINFVNNGPSDANTVTVTDAVPTNTTFVSAVVTTGTGWSTSAPAVGGTGNIVFSKAMVPAGETAVFTIVVNVNANTATGSIITNTATAATTTTDPNSSNNTATATTDIQAQADLSVLKTDSPDPVIAGQNITYTINFANAGPGGASNVTVTDAVPTNTTFVSATVTTGTGWSTSAPAVGGTGNVVFSKAAIGSSETAVFTIVVKVNANTANGETIVNMAIAASDTADPDPMDNTSTAMTAVITQADLSVTKSDSPDPVIAGSNITYTINFTNNGPSDAQMVNVSDMVPSGTTFVSAFVISGMGWTPSTPGVGMTGTVSFTKGTVAAGETATFEITVNVPSNTASGATISNTASASTTTTDPVSGNNSSSTMTSVITRADLVVMKTDSPDPVFAGNNLTYTVSFVNNGPSDAQTVTVTDGVPVNTTFVSAMVTTGTGWSTSAPAVGGTGNVVFSKGTAVAGETATFTIVVKVNPNTADGTIITNSAVGASTTTDPDPTNNTGTATTTVQARADLAVTKSDSPDPAAAGTNITYTISFVNNGPSFAQSVDVADTVPANTTFVSATVTTGTGWTTNSPAPGGTGSVNFTKASVTNGETATFTIVVKINSNTASGAIITNSATASSTTVDPDSSNNTGTATTNIVAQADLAVTKTDSPDPVNAGQNITYTISFVNNGPSDAQTVTVTDAVPANTTFVSAVVTTGTGWSTAAPAVGGTGNIVFSKATVISGETATFTIVVNVNANTANGATITNSVTADTTTDDLTPGNDTATATTTVQTRADLLVTKTDTPDPVIAGNDITYTISFTNNGPSDAQNVTVTDAVPANTTFVSAMVATGTGWSTSAPGVGASSGNTVFSKGTVTPGETATFTVVVKVNANTANGATITNSAVGASDTVDPTPGNNTGTATTAVITRVDLAVVKTDSPDPVAAGANLTYTINFSNSGPSDAQTVAVTDAVPANTTFVSAVVTTGTGWTTTAPAVGGTGNVVFSKATVGATETAVFTIVVKVNSNTASGATITNTATATTATTDTNAGNDSDSEMTAVITSADLAVVKTDSPDPVVATNNLTYTINFVNNGPSDAQTVNVSDIVPAMTTFVSATVTTGTGWTTTAPAVGSTGTTVSFTKGTVVAGETAVFTIVVNVNANAPHNSTITNTATATTATTDPNMANNTSTATTTVIAQADLAVTKSDSPDPVCVNGNITYTVSFVNNGPGPGLMTTVTDTVPANTTFVSAAAPMGWGVMTPMVGGTGNVQFSKASVADDETAMFTIVVKVNAGTAHHTVITNTVQAASSIPDPDTTNNMASAQTTVDPVAPTITCPANVVGTTPGPGQPAGTVNYPLPTAMDNCAVASVVCNPPSGSMFPVGPTTVNCTATDTAGNTAMCSFQVNVFDVCLQDDTNAGTVLLFNSFTGDYIFCCNGTSYTGTGTVNKQGSIITLSHTPAGRRVTGRVDGTTKKGSGSLQISGVNLCSITDRDIRNNSCNCGGNP